MSGLFYTILRMSVSASVIALIVIIARYFLRNSPKLYSYILWAAVLLRMICPFSLTLEIPMETQTELLSPTIHSEQVNTPDILVSEDPVYSATPEFPSDTETDPEHTNTPVATIPNTENPVKTAVKPINVLTAVWLIGVAAMLGYMAWSYISLYSHVKTSTRVRGTVFKSDRINTAFVLGLINPRVYIPSYLSFDDAKGVILHEQTHIRRGDHIVKIVAFASLAVHWFNPFIWLSYWLMSIDMEHSCDEAVMDGLCDRGYKLSGVKRRYGQILISLAIKDIKMPSVAFSENNVKGRLSHILNYKGASNNTRKILWASCAALFIFCALLPVIKGTEVDAVNSGHIAESPIDYSALELDYSNAGLDDLSAFADCKNLVSLDLSGNSITDISPLAEISTLKRLDLSENNISDFSALGSLNSLEHLAVSLYDNNLSALSELKKLPKFRSLAIYCGSADASKKWSDKYDLSLLAELESIEHLQIYMWNTNCDLSVLSDMPRLSLLRLIPDHATLCTMPDVPSETLTDLSLHLPLNADASYYLQAIASPKRLRAFSITTGEIELAHLIEYSGLETLTLDLCDDIDFGELKKLEKLWQLSYSKHDETPPDISGISELTSVTSLSLTLCNLTDISPIGKMTQLVFLDLSGNRIEDISPLSSLSELNSLYLCSNLVSDVSPLNCLANLRKLAVNDNPIEYSDIANGIPDLTQCFIASDRYENGNLGIWPELPSEGLEFEITDGQAYVTGYSGKDSDIVIASSYCGFPITRIADRAFSGSSITSIFMPDSIQTIGDEAFFNCTDLSVICWSQSLKSLGKYSFSHCKNLRELILPNSLSQMGYSCFAECTAITEIHFSEKLSVIPENCFSGCLSLTAVTIPKTVSEVSYHAFYNTPNLKEAHVISGPSLCSVMGFSENTTVNISYEVGYKGLEYELIDGKAYVTGYTYIPVDESAISVEDCSDTPIIPFIYEGCPVVGIADRAFSGEDCKHIRNISISYGLTEIGAEAFSGCSNLTRMDIPTSLNNISPRAFDGCGNETVVMSYESEYLLMYFADKDVEYHQHGEYSFG